MVECNLAKVEVEGSNPFTRSIRQRASSEALWLVDEETLVDEDVDPFDSNDVLWAMTTRFQADADGVTIPGVRCHPLDPSQSPEMSPSIRSTGITCKAIFDCTVPFELKSKFQRAQFKDVDYQRFFQ